MRTEKLVKIYALFCFSVRVLINFRFDLILTSKNCFFLFSVRYSPPELIINSETLGNASYYARSEKAALLKFVSHWIKVVGGCRGGRQQQLHLLSPLGTDHGR